MILRCELCGADLGTFEPEDLALPLTGTMFKPLGPGFPPPFSPLAEWAHLLCPVSMVSGRPHRACGWDLDDADTMVRPDRILTPEGYFIVGKGLEVTGPPAYVHDSTDLAKEWNAAEAERTARREKPATKDKPAKGGKR